MGFFTDFFNKKRPRTSLPSERGTSQSIAWFRDNVRRVQGANPEEIINTPQPFKRMQSLSINSIGKMYMFNYDPKLKQILPYYDVYPIIFPIEFYSDGFLGINLHYLPPALRAKLMDALWAELTNDKFNNTTKLKISYYILKSAARYSLFKPCIKRYLFTHVRSLFLYVSPDEWEIAMMLPTERFVKASNQRVWFDSQMRARK